MRIHSQIDGVKELQGTVERTIVRVRREAKKYVLAEAEDIMKESRGEVPVDTGALLNSAYIEQQGNGDVVFGYGKQNAQVNSKTGKSTEDYMMAVHERLDVRHPVGKAKFLEDPVNRHAAVMAKKMADKWRKFFGLGRW